MILENKSLSKYKVYRKIGSIGLITVSSHRLLGKEELGIKASVIDNLFPEIILKIFLDVKKRVSIPIKKIFRISARHDKRRNST